ncbi:MAG: alpha/beta fold hydrolase [Sulfurifustis sp.]
MEPSREYMNKDLLRSFWTYRDHARRIQGAFMDRLGFGPETTPSRVVGTWRTARLLAYQPARRDAPVVLLLPAPIKAAYIWDLAADVSVVRRCLAEGMQVYMVEWQRPQPDDEAMGLAEYADSLVLSCVDAIAAETGGSQVCMAGHSLGGTLAAIFASLHADRLTGLVELEGPMHFSETGVLESAVLATSSASEITDALGNVPGSFLNVASRWADPVTFEWEPRVDAFTSGASSDAIRNYWRVIRWALDEMPMPRRLFEDIIDGLYRENRFARDRLQLGRRVAHPKAITVPILAVADPRSRVVPWTSVEAYRDHTGSAEVQLLEYIGDVGVVLQHVGILIGERAHKMLWPQIGRWIHERGVGRTVPRGKTAL